MEAEGSKEDWMDLEGVKDDKMDAKGSKGDWMDAEGSMDDQMDAEGSKGDWMLVETCRALPLRWCWGRVGERHDPHRTLLATAGRCEQLA